MPISSSSQPAMMAEMLELLELAPGQRVLEIGAGTGYNAAVVSQIVGPKGRVTTIDIDPEIAQRAKAALRKNGSRVDVRHGDGRAGFAQGQPYDRIIVTASAEVVQPAWLEQLTEGGRIIVPLRLDPDADSIQLIPVFERRGRRVALVGDDLRRIHATPRRRRRLVGTPGEPQRRTSSAGPGIPRSHRSAARRSAACPTPRHSACWPRCSRRRPPAGRVGAPSAAVTRH